MKLKKECLMNTQRLWLRAGEYTNNSGRMEAEFNI